MIILKSSQADETEARARINTLKSDDLLKFTIEPEWTLIDVANSKLTTIMRIIVAQSTLNGKYVDIFRFQNPSTYKNIILI